MARKNFSDEFRRQAVDVYESTPGATVRGIAADLGVERGTLRHWLDLYGTGRKTAADGTPPRSPLKPKSSTPPGAADETAEQELVRLRARVVALNATLATRGTLDGAVFHSDHGAVYTSRDYAGLCDRLGVTQSMGAVGTSADNALAETFNATLKREVLQDAACWPDADTCRREVFRWLVRYNTRRRHSWCGYQSPAAYETLNAATRTEAA